ncbi:MAG: hypothetical protein C0483_10755 [Pirellula sp.]|nr:hypothetical protein [Pirellula sp.]
MSVVDDARNFAEIGPHGFPHAWNEVVLRDGRRVIVDMMHHGGKPKFLDVTEREAIERYLRVDDTPWYSAKTEAR